MAEAKKAHKIGEFKGSPVIILDPDGTWPFSLGRNKAKLVVANFEAVKAFAEDSKKEPDFGD